VTNIDPTTAATFAGAATGYSGAAAQKPKNELDKDAFLKLLVTQLRYQDPTAPMDSSAFMAQTSQLTSVEKLTELATTSRSAFDVQQRLGSAALIGRQVSWTAEDGSTSSGTVSAVSLTGTVPLLRVGSLDVPLDQVTAVVAAPATA
jgi:flagellar basal-body rod modification protein FlgD